MIIRLGRGLTLAAAACLAFAVAANAEDAQPATTPATPAVKAKTATVKKPPSECAGLDEPTCGSKPVCTWYKEAKLKDGKTRKAHCQKKPTHTAKKPAATTTPAAGTTTTPPPPPKN
jgi:hypothetical protein